MSNAIQKDHSLKQQAWKHFKKNKPAFISLFVLAFLAITALLAPLIANEKPLYCNYDGHTFFPAFSLKNNYTFTDAHDSSVVLQLDNTDWKQMTFNKVIWAPVPYSAGDPDILNAPFKGPGDPQLFEDAGKKIISMPRRFRHVLGTNGTGEDVLAGLIYGSRISLTIGFISMGIAACIGLLLGSIAGYFGDNGLHTTRARFWLTVIGISFGWFYAFRSRGFILSDALNSGFWASFSQIIVSLFIFAVTVFIFSLAGKLFGRVRWLNKKVNIPADAIISRTIEILNSLPLLILIITVASISKPSLTNLMVIIGLTNWTGIARLTRTEFLKIRELEYIQAAKTLGVSRSKIILKHALPNGIAPAMVAIAFGIAAAILIESSLSFLGIGVPPEIVTWGRMVSDGRENFSAWWLVLFPGMAIFITVTVYNLIGEGLRDALDPKLK